MRIMYVDKDITYQYIYIGIYIYYTLNTLNMYIDHI